jgi:hypothetical protein
MFHPPTAVDPFLVSWAAGGLDLAELNHAPTPRALTGRPPGGRPPDAMVTRTIDAQNHIRRQACVFYGWGDWKVASIPSVMSPDA